MGTEGEARGERERERNRKRESHDRSQELRPERDDSGVLGNFTASQSSLGGGKVPVQFKK